MAAKIGPAGPILAAKLVRGDQFWQKFLPKLVRLDQILGGTDFGMTGLYVTKIKHTNLAIGSYFQWNIASYTPI